MNLRIGSLCSGYGGLDMAVQAVFGGELAWVADPDPGAAAILAHHHPDVPNLGDITKTNWEDVARVDLLCGGFPCQDVSAAGKRSGIGKGTRTGIWAQIAEAIGVLRPQIVILENVPGLLAPLPMEEPNDRCVCGWPRGWRGLHHDPHAERGVLDPRGHRDDDQGEVGPGVDALDLRRLDTPLTAGDGTVGGGDLLARVRPGGGEVPHPHQPASEVEGGAGCRGTEDGGDPDFSGAVRSGISLDPGSTGTVLDPAAESQGAEPEGPDLPGPAGVATADCPACGRPVGDGSGRSVRRSGLEVVLRDLAYLGFDVEWCTVRASEVGAPHRRERLFVVATSRDASLRGRHAASAPRVGGQCSWASGRSDLDAPADTAGDGRDEGRAESAGLVGRPDAALGGHAPSADTVRVELARERREERRHATASWRGQGDIAWGAYAPAIRRWEHILGRPAPRPTEPGRTGERLSPAFVEWLMGLPAGHVTDVPGLSRNQQLKALGNGVVPQQATAALMHLTERRAAA